MKQYRNIHYKDVLDNYKYNCTLPPLYEGFPPRHYYKGINHQKMIPLSKLEQMATRGTRNAKNMQSKN